MNSMTPLLKLLILSGVLFLIVTSGCAQSDRIILEIKEKKLLKGVHEGITDTRVKNILGEPTHDQKWIVGQPMFGVGPELPRGTEYQAWNYFVNDSKISGIAIFLVSPETYSNITGKETSSNDWIVIGTYLHPRGVVF